MYNLNCETNYLCSSGSALWNWATNTVETHEGTVKEFFGKAVTSLSLTPTNHTIAEQFSNSSLANCAQVSALAVSVFAASHFLAPSSHWSQISDSLNLGSLLGSTTSLLTDHNVYMGASLGAAASTLSSLGMSALHSIPLIPNSLKEITHKTFSSVLYAARSTAQFAFAGSFWPAVYNHLPVANLKMENVTRPAIATLVTALGVNLIEKSLPLPAFSQAIAIEAPPHVSAALPSTLQMTALNLATITSSLLKTGTKAASSVALFGLSYSIFTLLPKISYDQTLDLPIRLMTSFSLASISVGSVIPKWMLSQNAPERSSSEIITSLAQFALQCVMTVSLTMTGLDQLNLPQS